MERDTNKTNDINSATHRPEVKEKEDLEIGAIIFLISHTAHGRNRVDNVASAFDNAKITFSIRESRIEARVERVIHCQHHMYIYRSYCLLGCFSFHCHAKSWNKKQNEEEKAKETVCMPCLFSKTNRLPSCLCMCTVMLFRVLKRAVGKRARTRFSAAVRSKCAKVFSMQSVMNNTNLANKIKTNTERERLALP